MSAPNGPGLALVEDRLRACVGGAGLLGAAASHLAAGHRVRPRLLLALGRIAGTDEPTLVNRAAAVELIHTASLLHDDVVDGAAERRGLPATHVRYGAGAAVLAGDVLLARALALLGHDAHAVSAAVDAVADMAAGAVREIEHRGDVDLAPDDALAIAAAKTGALFALCGRLAADGDAAGRFERAGRELGVAFQLGDDVDDVAGDLGERTPTLPIVLAARADADIRRAVRVLWRVDVGDVTRPSALSPLAERILRAARADVERAIERCRAEASAQLAPWPGAVDDVVSAAVRTRSAA